MTKIIGLVQVKGGAGRSTFSTNLAGKKSKLGKKSYCAVTDIITKMLKKM
jgi:MinD-like ATPase involved in chromosome partitioning or flagellar assembly